jgi:hypothetical protein
MFFVIGEFLVCCFIVIGSVLLHKAHAAVSDGIFLTYIAFVLLNYFVVRWRHERLKYKVRKFKKTRRKFLNFDFGTPDPPSHAGKSSSPPTPPKKRAK